MPEGNTKPDAIVFKVINYKLTAGIPRRFANLNSESIITRPLEYNIECVLDTNKILNNTLLWLVSREINFR